MSDNDAHQYTSVQADYMLNKIPSVKLLRCTGQNIKEVKDFLLIKHCHLCVTFAAVHRVECLWFQLLLVRCVSLLLSLPLPSSLSGLLVWLGDVLQHLVSHQSTVHHKHGSVLGHVPLMSAETV